MPPNVMSEADIEIIARQVEGALETGNFVGANNHKAATEFAWPILMLATASPDILAKLLLLGSFV